MSDRPSRNRPQDDSPKPDPRMRAPSGGWHAPTTSDETSGWRVPAQAEEQTGGWRVPALPQDLDIVPDDAGIWHLPRPEDTTFRPDDEIEISRSPEGGLQPDTATAPLENEASADGMDAAARDASLPFDDVPGGAAPQATLDALIAESAGLPFGPESSAAARNGDDLIAPALLHDEDDEDSFSMSELIALASLVEDQPQARSTADAAPAPTADPNDPAEYARRQLERLSAEQPQPAATTTAPEAAEAPAASEPSAAELVEAGQASLAKKYHETEEKVRGLRRQYRNGQLTRDQLQTELRRLMVLDDDNVWWMLGVETDTWYKFSNGQWLPETPPALAAEQEVDTGMDTMPSAPMLPGDRTVATSAINLPDEYMPLPRSVPVRDPDYTLPGAAGFRLPPVPNDLGVTQPVRSQPTIPNAAVSGETVASAPADLGTQPGVPAPREDVAPPSYDLRSKASPTYDQVLKQKRQSMGRLLAILAIVGVALLFLLGACGIVGGIAYYSSLSGPYQDEIAALANYQPEFQTARILDAEGNMIAELTSRDGGARQKIALRDVSPFLIHAVLATENERYYDDPGWDAIAIGRAIAQNAVSGQIESGASTITQQIARNLILHDTTVSTERKLQEIVIASEIAQRYDKNFILELYLNEFFFGNRSYGVEAASQFYFGKSAADLNMAESAMIAGMLQAPATYDPVVNSEAAFDRMETVLRLMRDVGCIQFQHEPYLGEPFCIGDAQIRIGPGGDIVGGTVLVERALVETRSFRPREYTIQYPHFVNFVQAQIEQSFGTAEMYRRGFTIRTTLIPRIQDAAQNALAQNVSAASGSGLDTGAVLVADPTTGAIRAMVGSPDFNNESIDGQVNNVLTWQQPGSSIKPIVYTAALEGIDRGGRLDYMTAASILWDVPTTYNTQPPYQPLNYDRRFRGPVSVRSALQNSYNVPAVKAFEFIGVDKFRDMASRMGLRFLDDATFGLSSALGSNEIRLYDHVQAYGVLANGGRHVPLYTITSITDSDGNQVEIPPRPEPVQVISPQVAYVMDSILTDNEARAAAFGTNSGLSIPGYEGLVAAKTGTTNDNRDLWTMGFTSNMVVGVWTGRVDNQATTATTALAAIPIWNEVMRSALQGNTPAAFPDPGGIVAAQICADTGTVYDPAQGCTGTRTELFLQNQPPPPASHHLWTGGSEAGEPQLSSARSRKITGIGQATLSAISPDGKFIAYTNTTGGKQSLWLRQLSTETNVQLIAPQDENFYGLKFSHSGEYLYFSREQLNLFRIPTLGGAPTTLLTSG